METRESESAREKGRKGRERCCVSAVRAVRARRAMCAMCAMCAVRAYGHVCTSGDDSAFTSAFDASGATVAETTLGQSYKN